jgi:hypothetical protein
MCKPAVSIECLVIFTPSGLDWIMLISACYKRN